MGRIIRLGVWLCGDWEMKNPEDKKPRRQEAKKPRSQEAQKPRSPEAKKPKAPMNAKQTERTASEQQANSRELNSTNRLNSS